MLSGVLRGLRCRILRNSVGYRVSSVVCSSQGLVDNDTFIYLINTGISNRGFVPRTTSNKTGTIVIRCRMDSVPGGVTIVGIGGAEHTLTLVSTTFFNCPTHRLAAVNLANAGNGAAAACVMGDMLRTAKGGANLVNAANVLVKSRVLPTGGAAPRSCRLRGVFHRVISDNYGCTIVRMSDRNLGLSEICNVRFSCNIFAGFSPSRVKPGRRRDLRRCTTYGDLLFHRYGATIIGKSSDGAGRVLGKRAYGILACTAGGPTSLGTRGYRFVGRGNLLNVHFSMGNTMGCDFAICAPNVFSICGSLIAVFVYRLLNMRGGSIRGKLLAIGMENEMRLMPYSGSFSIVVSCTRGRIDAGDIVAALSRCGPGQVVYICNNNNGHSELHHCSVNRMANTVTSLYVLAYSGPHSRRVTSVGGSVGVNLTESGNGCVRVSSHGRTVGCTVGGTRGNSFVVLLNGKRRACRRVGNIGCRFSRHRTITRVGTRLNLWCWVFGDILRSTFCFYGLGFTGATRCLWWVNCGVG